METGQHGSGSTHIIFADETAYNDGRYRGIAAVSLKIEDYPELSRELGSLLKLHIASEFKWKDLRKANLRLAALQAIDFSLRYARIGILRIDVLTWDTHDRRHQIARRDDIANLQFMYRHLLKNVLSRRWPEGAIWKLCPDENSALNWNTVQDYLDYMSSRVEVRLDPFGNGKGELTTNQLYGVQDIVPCKSHDEPLIQLADLFAGLGVYSRSNFNTYLGWRMQGRSGQMSFENDDKAIEMGNSDVHRCELLEELNNRCKAAKLGVSLKTHMGLRTLKPDNPINFWWYEAQHELDMAPTKQKIADLTKFLRDDVDRRAC